MTNLSHTAGISHRTTIAFHEDVNREIHMTVSDTAFPCDTIIQLKKDISWSNLIVKVNVCSIT